VCYLTPSNSSLVGRAPDTTQSRLHPLGIGLGTAPPAAERPVRGPALNCYFLVAGGCPRSTTSDLRGDKHAGRRARTGQCIRRLPTQLRAVQVARPQKLDVTATFGLQTRRYCWSQDLHYAAAQALHYSIPLLRAWSPEKRPAPGGPRGLRVSMESRTQISACLSTERFQSLALTAAEAQSGSRVRAPLTWQ
jgi:hypothetical protein